MLSKYLPVIITIVGTVGATLVTPDFVAHHVALFGVLNAVAQLLHAALPSVFKG